MSYYYESNLDSLNRLDQVEIQLDNGDAAILRKGHYYDLTAGELQRARQYIVLTSSTVPADEQPIGVRYLPLKGNPTADQIPQWSANEAAFIPATVSGVSGGPYAAAADLDVVEAGLATAQAGVDAATADLVALKASPINVLDYGADPTGVTSSVAAFAAAVAACIPNTSPVTTARYAKRALYIPGGYYMTNTTALLSLTSVIGLRVLTDGPYATIFRADASMESIVDLNGIAHCHFDGFTCQSKSNGNDASVVVQKPFKMYWDNTTAARSTTDNRFEAIVVSDCRFVRGTQIGLDGSGLQCDSTQIDRCVVVGQAGFGYGDVANTTSTLLNCVVTAMAIGHELYGYGIQAGTTITNIVGSTITMSLPATASLTHSFIFSTAPGLWQRGIGVGSGVAGNNYGHHITMAQGGNVRYGLYVANTSGVIEQWDGLTNQTDFFFAGVGDGCFAIKSGRGEGSQRMMDTTGASSLSNNIEISDMIWFGNRQHGDRGWVKYFSGGSISLNRVKCYGLDATQPITPAVVITPNAVPRQMTHLTLDGCSIQAPLATLLSQMDTLRTNVHVRGYSEISSGLTPVLHTPVFPDPAVKPTGTALQYVDADAGNDANDGKSWGTAKLTLAAARTAMPNGGRLLLNAAAAEYQLTSQLDWGGYHIEGMARATGLSKSFALVRKKYNGNLFDFGAKGGYLRNLLLYEDDVTATRTGSAIAATSSASAGGTIMCENLIISSADATHAWERLVVLDGSAWAVSGIRKCEFMNCQFFGCRTAGETIKITRGVHVKFTGGTVDQAPTAVTQGIKLLDTGTTDVQFTNFELIGDFITEAAGGCVFSGKLSGNITCQAGSAKNAFFIAQHGTSMTWTDSGSDNTLTGPSTYETVASAATVTIPRAGRVIMVTGTTPITGIVATGMQGRTITLIWNNAAPGTLVNGNNLVLKGGTITPTQFQAVTLVSDGTNWYGPA